MNGRVICDPEDRYTQDDVNHYLEDIQTLLENARKESAASLKTVERYLCQHDLYYLGLFILGIDKMYSEKVTAVDGTVTEVFHPWLFNRCREVEARPDFCVDIWAREHFKSTIITLLKSVQDILCNPEVAICIYSYNSRLAHKFVRQIREAMENNHLKELFPDIIPEETHVGKYKTEDEFGRMQEKKFQWSDENFTVKRKTGRKEPTVSGYGLVTGQPTGMHFDILVYDDCVTPDSVRTQGQNEYTTEQWKMSLNTGSGESVKVRIIGTRYDERDTYFHILNPLYSQKGVMGGSKYRLRVYPCRKPDGTTVLYTPEYINDKETTMIGIVFAAQMMCNPQQAMAFRFQEEWLGPRCDHDEIYRRRAEFNWYIFVDPANTKKKTSDYTAMVLVGTGPDRRYYVPEIERDKLSLSERIDRIFSMVNKWSSDSRYPKVFWEQSGLSADMEMLRKEMEDRKFFFPLYAMGTKPRVMLDPRMNGSGMLKLQRILALEPLFRNYRIVLAKQCMKLNYLGQYEDVMQKFIDDEYLTFPLGDHDDGLDALCHIADAETGPMMTFPAAQISSKVQAEGRRLEYEPRFAEYIPF